MLRKLKVLLVALAVSAGMLVTGTSAGAPVKLSAAFGNKWVPATKSVSKGTKVVWKNPANLATEHNVRSYGSNWNLPKRTLDAGESTSKRFKKAGTFRFRCTLHSLKQGGEWTGMVGKIKVTK